MLKKKIQQINTLSLFIFLLKIKFNITLNIHIYELIKQTLVDTHRKLTKCKGIRFNDQSSRSVGGANFVNILNIKNVNNKNYHYVQYGYHAYLNLICNRHGHECSHIWKLSGNSTLIQCIKKCRDFFGPRYIGDDLFLGPNLVSFNRAVVPLLELSFLTKSQKLTSA